MLANSPVAEATIWVNGPGYLVQGALPPEAVFFHLKVIKRGNLPAASACHNVPLFTWHGKVPTPAATGVDTDQVAQVEHLAVGLGRVADDGDLAGAVRAGNFIAQREVQEDALVLLVQWLARRVVAVHEEVRGRFVVVRELLHERQMLDGERGDALAAVGIERGLTATAHPFGELRRVGADCSMSIS